MSTLHAIWLEALATHCRQECPQHSSLFFDEPLNPTNPAPDIPADNDLQVVRQTYPIRLTAHMKKAERLVEDRVRVHAIIHAQVGRSMTDALAMDPQYRARMDNSNALEYLRMICTLCRTGLVYEENAALNKSNRERALLLAFATIKQKHGQDLHAYYQELEEIIATSAHVEMPAYGAGMQVHQYLHGLDPAKYGDLIKSIDRQVTALPATLSAMHRLAISWHTSSGGTASSGIVLHDPSMHHAFSCRDVNRTPSEDYDQAYDQAYDGDRRQYLEQFEHEAPVTVPRYPNLGPHRASRRSKPRRADNSWITPTRAAPAPRDHPNFNDDFDPDEYLSRGPSRKHSCHVCGALDHWKFDCPLRRGSRRAPLRDNHGQETDFRGNRAQVNLAHIKDTQHLSPFEFDFLPSPEMLSDSESNGEQVVTPQPVPKLGTYFVHSEPNTERHDVTTTAGAQGGPISMIGVQAARALRILLCALFSTLMARALFETGDSGPWLSSSSGWTPSSDAGMEQMSLSTCNDPFVNMYSTEMAAVLGTPKMIGVENPALDPAIGYAMRTAYVKTSSVENIGSQLEIGGSERERTDGTKYAAMTELKQERLDDLETGTASMPGLPAERHKTRKLYVPPMLDTFVNMTTRAWR
jgi:hypothetical protein